MQDSFADSKPSEGLIELVTVLVAVTDHQARVLTVSDGSMLLSGPLLPVHHSLQAGVRLWVAEQTAQPMGYVEQLYTFVDTSRQNAQGLPVLYISYLGLVREAMDTKLKQKAKWYDWYDYFPWEDQRNGPFTKIPILLKYLYQWAEQTQDTEMHLMRLNRINLCWGLAPYEWQEEHVLLRYELLYEAGLIAESPYLMADFDLTITGKAMRYHHRRVLATAITRLRAKIKYRPVVYELLPPEFALLQLQNSVEALSGRKLHKQNFRRQIQQQAIIEPLAQSTHQGRGRPAQLYRFKHDVLLESLISDHKLPLHKSSKINQ